MLSQKDLESFVDSRVQHCLQQVGEHQAVQHQEQLREYNPVLRWFLDHIYSRILDTFQRRAALESECANMAQRMYWISAAHAYLVYELYGSILGKPLGATQLGLVVLLISTTALTLFSILLSQLLTLKEHKDPPNPDSVSNAFDSEIFGKGLDEGFRDALVAYRRKVAEADTESLRVLRDARNKLYTSKILSLLSFGFLTLEATIWLLVSR